MRRLTSRRSPGRGASAPWSRALGWFGLVYFAVLGCSSASNLGPGSDRDAESLTDGATPNGEGPGGDEDGSTKPNAVDRDGTLADGRSAVEPDDGGAGSDDGSANPAMDSGAPDGGASDGSVLGDSGSDDANAPFGDGGLNGSDGSCDGAECPPGSDCNAIEAACVSDADFVRTLNLAVNECGFVCSESPRVCALTTDGYCPSTCGHANDGDCERPNRLFVTKTAYNGDLGGLAGADAKCQASADSAGLGGTFIALLGSSTQTASERLGSARGFIRIDGAPFADEKSDLLFGNVFTAPYVNEYLEIMPPETLVATGFDRLGSPSFVCEDWTSSSEVGDFGRAGDGGDRFRYVGVGSCYVRLHLYCVETSQQVEVSPHRTEGLRRAFVARSFDRTSGLAGADADCMAAAATADLDGNYKALLSAGEQPAIARFDLSGAPWGRVDGTPIVGGAADLASGRLLAPLNQTADGTYESGFAWTGTHDLTRPGLDSCREWSSDQTPVTGQVGRITATGPSYLSDSNFASMPCPNEAGFIYCLEESGDGAVPDALPDSELNLIFVTEGTWSGDLGGLPGADAKCAEAAEVAGLTGTFVALLGTAGQSLDERLGTARGFMRTDLRPVADAPLDLTRGRLLYPPNLSELGNPIDSVAWTGTQNDCLGWTSDAAEDYGSLGRTGSGDLHSGPSPCSGSRRLLCAQTDHRAPLPEIDTSGYRLAFVAQGTLLTGGDSFYGVDPGAGLSGLDEQCETEATLYGLTGAFKALVATSSASAASRFDTNGPPWARVDGPLLAETAEAFFDLGRAVPLDVTADGRGRLSHYSVWFGADGVTSLGNQTCDDWTSRDNTASGDTASTTGVGPIQTSATGCDFGAAHLYCLEE